MSFHESIDSYIASWMSRKKLLWSRRYWSAAAWFFTFWSSRSATGSSCSRLSSAYHASSRRAGVALPLVSAVKAKAPAYLRESCAAAAVEAISAPSTIDL
jgi:hypothetical protein